MIVLKSVEKCNGREIGKRCRSRPKAGPETCRNSERQWRFGEDQRHCAAADRDDAQHVRLPRASGQVPARGSLNEGHDAYHTPESAPRPLAKSLTASWPERGRPWRLDLCAPVLIFFPGFGKSGAGSYFFGATGSSISGAERRKLQARFKRPRQTRSRASVPCRCCGPRLSPRPR